MLSEETEAWRGEGRGKLGDSRSEEAEKAPEECHHIYGKGTRVGGGVQSQELAECSTCILSFNPPGQMFIQPLFCR